MNKKQTGKIIVKSIITVIAILSFYIIGGAISQILEMGSIQTKLTQGVCVWSSVIIVMIYYRWKHSLAELGLRKVTAQGWKKIYYCIPTLFIVSTVLVTGVNCDSFAYILATLFLTIGVGFSEEIYFRGLILQYWKSEGRIKAIIVSSVLFGICHSANMIAGASLITTICQIVFALVYGCVFAQLFILSDSILPGIIIHFLNDFLVYITNEGTATQIGAVAVTQTVVLILYMILMFRKIAKDEHVKHENVQG